MVVYSLAIVAGPCIGPIIRSAVSQSYLGWRWTEVSFWEQRLTALIFLLFWYIIVILTSLIISIGYFLIPETFVPILLTEKVRVVAFLEPQTADLVGRHRNLGKRLAAGNFTRNVNWI